MPAEFPSNPTFGQTYEYDNVYWQWNGFGWAFKGATGEPPSSLVPGETQIVLFQSYENDGTPVGVDSGAFWFNTDSGILYLYVSDFGGASGNAWVQATILNNDITLPS